MRSSPINLWLPFASRLVARLACCVDEVDVRCAGYDGELQWIAADGPAKAATAVEETLPTRVFTWRRLFEKVQF